ncbi:TAXI family TRAP transporter solute-binding subunit [Pseudooceanicola sp. GBMRC 2024]|uniref:TAXI family TRAP transporter solute-binding subunit n=1 Tax=Pseudooceanicola albus TaxID=2692189 RepID=A0A6L7G0Y8_9RHOB|nr:TAXI family TRAP transporter solute-binding subunit [Pseudooceanicola albus]MXN17725.1 TAXI family TRAP transporter solute-binding subunit [Pseudooceanicola albus]
MKHAFLATALLSASLVTGAQAENLTLATGSSGGTYFPVGVALSTLVSEQLADKSVRMSPITTGGSAENVELLGSNEAQVAIMFGIYGRDGYRGVGLRQGRPPIPELRSITALWPDYDQFVLRKDLVKTGTLSDLDGLGAAFSVGPRNSGTEGTTRLLLDAVGIDPETAFKPTNMNYNAAAEAFQNGRIAGLSAAGGIPTPAVSQIYSTSADETAILQVSDEQAARIAEATDGLFTPVEIPAGTYPNQSEPIQTVMQPNFLAVRADVPEETVYEMTKAMFEHLDVLRAASSAAKVISLETALKGLPVPLHPGAARYFREQGIAIPENLVN